MGALAQPGATAKIGAAPAPDASKDPWPGFPHQDPALVREMVGASHARAERVKELLAAHPELAKCAYDWGFGDWESALGAASHVGNKPIAQMLLDHGARLDIYAAAMLGMTDAVRAMLAAQPSLARTRGPHGISLVAHATAGKHDELAAYLKTIDGADSDAPTPLTEEQMKVYLGSFVREPDAGGSSGEVTVSQTRFGLAVRAGTSTDCRLIRTGEHTFHPAGAPGVRVTFTVNAGAATRIELVEGAWFVSAARKL